jgi:adenylate cyclase
MDRLLVSTGGFSGLRWSSRDAKRASVETPRRGTIGSMTDQDGSGQAAASIEHVMLGGPPTLTRLEVAELSGVPLETAEALWHWLGFAHVGDDDVVFTPADVEALKLTRDLMDLGVLGADSQAALVRTWASSFARLAEWQTGLIASLAPTGPDSQNSLLTLAATVTDRVDTLQSYVWRRHLAAATNRLLVTEDAADPRLRLAVAFVDIVDYTAQSQHLTDAELVRWIELFENEVTSTVVDHGGRVIKTIGDEVLYVAENPVSAAEIALQLTARGEDDTNPFPAVRAGIAYGPVVSRLGDVFGPTVNIAARLTSVARPGTVIIDSGLQDVLDSDSASPYTLRRLRGVAVKGYSHLACWVLRRARTSAERDPAGPPDDDELLGGAG